MYSPEKKEMRKWKVKVWEDTRLVTYKVVNARTRDEAKKFFANDYKGYHISAIPHITKKERVKENRKVGWCVKKMDKNTKDKFIGWCIENETTASIELEKMLTAFLWNK